MKRTRSKQEKRGLVKFLSLILSLSLVFSLASCGKQVSKEEETKQALDKLQTALEKTFYKDYNGLDAEFKMNVNADISGTGKPKDLYIKADVRTNLLKGRNDKKDLEAFIKTKHNLNTGEQNYDIYIKDGLVYTKEPYHKLMQPIDYVSYGLALEKLLKMEEPKLDRDLAKSAKIEADKILVDLNMAEVLKLAEGRNEEFSKKELDRIDMTVKKAELEISLADGKLSSVKLNLDMLEDKKENPQSAVGEIELVYKKVGDVEKVKFPADLSSYPGLGYE